VITAVTDQSDVQHGSRIKEPSASLRAVEGKALRTADSYAEDAKLLLQYLDRAAPGIALGQLTLAHIVAYLVDQEDRGRVATTRRRSIFAIRSFLNFTANTTGRDTVAHAVTPPKAGETKTAIYTQGDIQRLLAHGRTQTTLRGRLAYTILVTAWSTGLRRSELAALKLGDVDLEARRLTLIGKGDKQRRVPIPHHLVELLDQYLTDVRPHLPGEVFLFANPNSQPAGPYYGSISEWTLAKLITGFCVDAGVEGKTNMHKFRHTYATTVLRAGSDVHTVQRLLGHSAIQTTLRYLHLVDDDLRAVVDKAFD
jgi:site-specific recombinase XerD